MADEAVKVRLRLITQADRKSVVTLLAEGFTRRNLAYWQTAWERLTTLEKPAGFDSIGYILEVNSEAVGVILILAAAHSSHYGSKTRANLSSWYVRSEYRSYATMLLSRACKEKDVTFLNVSAAEHTYAICEALGFERYSQGQLACAPLLSRNTAGLDINAYAGPMAGLSEANDRLLRDHLTYGCLCLVGTGGETIKPFIFVRRKIKGFLPVVQLIYCGSTTDFTLYAGRIGMFLAARGIMIVILDANGPVQGLTGKYFGGRSPKYYKGKDIPALGDLAYTEIALFGI